MSGILKADGSRADDNYKIKQSIDILYHLLHKYIPYACKREVENTLWNYFEQEGIELTTKMMRKEYEAWKSLHIEGLLTQAMIPINKEMKE